MEKSFSHTLGGAAVWSIALILTLFDVLCRGCAGVLKIVVKLLVQITAILLISAAVILMYMIVALLCTAATPWFNSHIH